MLCEELPGIMWFENDNEYTECDDLFHYIILPNTVEKTMTAKIWYGKYCYSKSKDIIVSERTFLMTNDGRSEMIEYIRNENSEYRK